MLDKQGCMHARACTRPRARAHGRTRAHTHKYVIFIVFPLQHRFTNAPLCYVIRTLDVLFVISLNEWMLHWLNSPLHWLDVQILSNVIISATTVQFVSVQEVLLVVPLEFVWHRFIATRIVLSAQVNTHNCVSDTSCTNIYGLCIYRTCLKFFDKF